MTSPIKTPETWKSEQYIRPIELTTGGIRAWTHLAALKRPDGTSCRGYVKHFPSNYTKALLNEWMGYTIMHRMGVPQPPAAIMPAPAQALPGAPLAWAFVSCQPSPTFDGTPAQLYDIRDPAKYAALIKRIFSCHALPLLIACDQLLKNNDRNLGNLVFTGKSSFVAIDHSDVFGGPSWEAKDTHFKQEWSRSKLIEDLMAIQTVPANIKSAIVASAELVAEAYIDAQRELALALNSGAESDVKSALDMVWWRTLPIQEWFKEKFLMI